MNITQIKQLEKVVIIEIHGDKNFVNKLDSMGIRLGVGIIKISSQFLQGPITIKIGNTQVAISYSIAKRIIVEIVK
ncbi:MAG: FeoA family protein [bacterium]